MTNQLQQNEQIKRRFYDYLKGGDGFAADSVTKFAEAIQQWQIFSNNEDFTKFTKERASEYCDWLKTRPAKTKSGTLSLTTQYHYLRRLKKFFHWFSDQPEYRTKIRKTDIEFLRLSKKDARIATAGTTKKMPTFDDVKKIILAIGGGNEIDMRDRALISFALITGMRISAIVSVKMKNFDCENKWVDQNPGDGVLTKNSKKILTTFFPIGWSEPESYFLEWYDYQIAKGAKLDDPIFPSTLRGFSGRNTFSKTQVSDEEWSSSGGARKVFEKRCKTAGVQYFHPHSFRHLVVSIMSKTPLTEEQKKAISMNLGHENVGTTFGAYGYGHMNPEKAVQIVREIPPIGSEKDAITPEEKVLFEKLAKKVLGA